MRQLVFISGASSAGKRTLMWRLHDPHPDGAALRARLGITGAFRELRGVDAAEVAEHGADVETGLVHWQSGRNDQWISEIATVAPEIQRRILVCWRPIEPQYWRDVAMKSLAWSSTHRKPFSTDVDYWKRRAHDHQAYIHHLVSQHGLPLEWLDAENGYSLLPNGPPAGK